MSDAVRNIRLDSVARILAGGKSGLTGNHFVDSGYPAFGAGGLNGFLPEFEFEDGAIILSSIGARCGKCFYPVGKWASLANTQLIFPNPELVDRKFLWYQLNDESLWHRSGTAQPYIKPSDVKGQLVSLPPLPEQRRIADILDRADDLRAQRRRALELLRSMESALFDVMFRDLAGDHVQLKDIVPAGDRINYGVVQPGSETPGGVPIIRVGDLQGGLVRRTRLKHISAEIESAYSRSRLKGNEILVSCVGSIGEIAVARPDDIGSNIARAVARVPVADDVERIYFATQLRSKRVQDYFVSELRTVSQPTLNIKQLAETEVVVATRAMQSEFASRVAKIEMLLKSHSEALARLDEVFASLQHRAFGGEL